MHRFHTILSSYLLWSLFIVVLCTLTRTGLADQPVTLKTTPFQTAVVELYTSEGCSSCPPAERWLEELITIPRHQLDALVLEFHVDYWDYIGWKDPFASADYTTRQRHLAKQNRQRSVYTPEFFVNGIETRGTGNVIKKIQAANATPAPVQLELSAAVHNRQLELELSNQLPSDQSIVVNLVIFENHLSSTVTRGENRGKQLNHQRVVRLFSPARPAKPEMTYTVPLSSDWVHQNLGFGILFSNQEGEYIQAFSALLNPDS